MTEEEIMEWRFVHALLDEEGRDQTWCEITGRWKENQSRTKLPEPDFMQVLRTTYKKFPTGIAMTHALTTFAMLPFLNLADSPGPAMAEAYLGGLVVSAWVWLSIRQLWH